MRVLYYENVLREGEFTSRGYKGIGPSDLHILNDEIILIGGEIMRNLLYKRKSGQPIEGKSTTKPL